MQMTMTSFDVAVLVKKVREFIDQHVLPNEVALQRPSAQTLKDCLTSESMQNELWGIFLPMECGGQLSTLENYLLVAEEEGRSEFGPAILGTDTALDVRWLMSCADKSLLKQYLPHLLRGGVAAFGATEPGLPGSLPQNIQTHVTSNAQGWVLNGSKWYISRGDKAAFITVLAKVSETSSISEKAFISPSEAAACASHSETLALFLVPVDAPGVTKIRRHQLLGRDYDQWEFHFSNVHLSFVHRLDSNGKGKKLLEERLKIGRLVRSMHWLGLAQRCLTLSVERINSARGQLTRLPEKQLLRAKLFESYQKIQSTRAWALSVAAQVDAGESPIADINAIKVLASRALCESADAAIQIWGVEGLDDENPLSSIYRFARTTQMMDGANEALINSTSRKLLMNTF